MCMEWDYNLTNVKGQICLVFEKSHKGRIEYGNIWKLSNEILFFYVKKNIQITCAMWFEIEWMD